MKARQSITMLVLTVLLLSAFPLRAQISQADALILINALVADETPPESIVERLLEEGLTLEEILSLLGSYTNQQSVAALMMALVDSGIPAEDAAARVVAMHSDEASGSKLIELERAGLTKEMGARLLVVLALNEDPLVRMAMLTSEMGLAVQEAAQLLNFLTVQPTPREMMDAMVLVGIDSATAGVLLVANNVAMDADAVLEAMLDQGLSFAQATEIITNTDPSATFTQPLDEIVSQVFTPSNFSNDALTGAAGGGVSTSQ